MALKEEHRGHVPEDAVAPGSTIATLTVDGVVVASYCDGAGLPPVLAPRPFLHPVTTLAGTPVTDAQPEDHRWHLGVSVTLQDVGGANVWGGRTYVRGEGYTWLGDHGRQVHTGWRSRADSGFRETVRWEGPDGRPLLSEGREVRAARSELPGAWALDLDTSLRNVTGAPLSLGSPASNGRAGAGYGGLFWRLPVADAPRVFTAAAEGEDAVHGSVSPWVAVTSGGHSPATVVLAGRDAATRRDPWFVRVSDYPGLGAQLAAEQPVRLTPGNSVTRRFRALVVDGAPDPDEIDRALSSSTAGNGSRP
ncbi:Methane oxygenase PmoA [Geodermatophilus obscurus]|uniref:Methane oxygenase PmoA n=1 Tax=Geodermatophilus obscurus TaxID=1861 RepID=A0A1I5CXQ8_9ACTN|nr:Methane oxygenase PmoA [Geodermatophilus obscurus]